MTGRTAAAWAPSRSNLATFRLASYFLVRNRTVSDEGDDRATVLLFDHEQNAIEAYVLSAMHLMLELGFLEAIVARAFHPRAWVLAILSPLLLAGAFLILQILPLVFGIPLSSVRRIREGRRWNSPRITSWLPCVPYPTSACTLSLVIP